MKAPLKVLIGWIIIVIALVVIVFYRYDLIEGIKRTTAVKTDQSSETAIKTTSAQMNPAPAQTNPTPAPVTKVSSASLENGKKLFEEKTCVLCHGASGKADTPTGQAMKATNLTLGTFNNNVEKLESTAYILKVIENGVPGTAMVSFKAQIPNAQDRKDLANYVHSLSNK